MLTRDPQNFSWNRVDLVTITTVSGGKSAENKAFGGAKAPEIGYLLIPSCESRASSEGASVRDEGGGRPGGRGGDGVLEPASAPVHLGPPSSSSSATTAGDRVGTRCKETCRMNHLDREIRRFKKKDISRGRRGDRPRHVPGSWGQPVGPKP